MWIEVIGLPGVGKTTMIEQNLDSIQKKFTIVESRKPNLINKIIAKALYYFFYKHKTNDTELARKLSYRHSFRFLKNKKSNLFFYDSGMLQLILENLIETNFKEQNEKLSLLSLFSLPNKVIYITDDLDNIAQREVNRTTSRFGFSLEETTARYKQATQIIEKELLQSAPFIDTIGSQNHEEFIKAVQSEKTH